MKIIFLFLTILAFQSITYGSKDPMTLRLKNNGKIQKIRSSHKQEVNPKRGLVVDFNKKSHAASFVASDEYKDQDFSRLDEEVELLK